MERRWLHPVGGLLVDDDDDHDDHDQTIKKT